MKVPLAENLRFPAQRKSEQGESAPKVRRKRVIDGNQVNSPGLYISAKGGRRRLGEPGDGYPGRGTKTCLVGKSAGLS